MPIDENGDGTTVAYASSTRWAATTGTRTRALDAINDPTCTVSYGDETFPDRAAFVAAHSNHRVATDALTFIIVDQPGTFKITNVQLGRARPSPSGRPGDGRCRASDSAEVRQAPARGEDPSRSGHTAGTHGAACVSGAGPS
jgi:hypothetical protein